MSKNVGRFIMEEKTIGQIIREKRTAKGYTQEQLAEKVGVTPQAVSKWENDSAYPDIALIKRLAEILGCSVGELLGEEKETRMIASEKVDTSKMFLKIRVSSGNDKVNVNIPVAIIEMVMENEQIISLISSGKDDKVKDAIRSIDIKSILQMISMGVMGKLIEIETEDGEKVEIYVE